MRRHARQPPPLRSSKGVSRGLPCPPTHAGHLWRFSCDTLVRRMPTRGAPGPAGRGGRDRPTAEVVGQNAQSNPGGHRLRVTVASSTQPAFPPPPPDRRFPARAPAPRAPKRSGWRQQASRLRGRAPLGKGHASDLARLAGVPVLPPVVAAIGRHAPRPERRWCRSGARTRAEVFPWSTVSARYPPYAARARVALLACWTLPVAPEPVSRARGLLPESEPASPTRPEEECPP